MSIQKLKTELSFSLKDDQHCYYAIEKLLSDKPYDKMSLIGKIALK